VEVDGVERSGIYHRATGQHIGPVRLRRGVSVVASEVAKLYAHLPTATAFSLMVEVAKAAEAGPPRTNTPDLFLGAFLPIFRWANRVGWLPVGFSPGFGGFLCLNASKMSGGVHPKI